MSDIVERLRVLPCPSSCDCILEEGSCPLTEAAAEIERLRDELDKAHRALGEMVKWQHPLERDKVVLEAEIERLRGELELQRRPVAFRVRNRDIWALFENEQEAQIEAGRLNTDYQGLYVRIDWSRDTLEDKC